LFLTTTIAACQWDNKQAGDFRMAQAHAIAWSHAQRFDLQYSSLPVWTALWKEYLSGQQIASEMMADVERQLQDIDMTTKKLIYLPMSSQMLMHKALGRD
jgi:hypothetical protein